MAAIAATTLGACGSGSGAGSGDGFVMVGSLDVGRNPHQISFSEDGRTAWVAVAGEDAISVVHVERFELMGTIEGPPSPLGVVPMPNGLDLAITSFTDGGVHRFTRTGSRLGGDRLTGVGASTMSGPFPGDRYLVSVEEADSLLVFDAAGFTFTAAYPTGARPFPAGATSDGRLAFVPSYDDGTVTVVDLFNDRVLETVAVGTQPSGGAVLPGDIDYAVVLRGENRVVFMNTASRQIVGGITEGIGESPFSFVVSPNGRLGFVNNTGSHDVSVIDLASRTVIARVGVPNTPIVMAVHPTSRALWVSSEGEHRLSVIAIPESWRDNPANRPEPLAEITQVGVMGMTHSQHLTSDVWGLEEIEQTVRAFAPDVLCTEIAPDRWERIDRELRERDVIEDPRVLRFPEYREVLLRLRRELGYTIEPCAGWSLEMSDLRAARIAAFDAEDRWADERAAYAEARGGLRRRDGVSGNNASDDPAYLHSEAYDQAQRAELESYDRYQNDIIGPGGWTNINVAHYRQVDRAIRAHAGKRILITFGAGHKYWLLEQLRRRDDVEIIDMGPYLPGG
jgi:YVTN family beta-propeller protein